MDQRQVIVRIIIEHMGLAMPGLPQVYDGLLLRRRAQEDPKEGAAGEDAAEHRSKAILCLDHELLWKPRRYCRVFLTTSTPLLRAEIHSKGYQCNQRFIFETNAIRHERILVDEFSGLGENEWQQ